MPVYDLTHTLTTHTAPYPGTPAPHIHPFAKIENEGFRELSLTLSTHIGTHMDAPAHMLANGSFLDELNPDLFFGTGIVVDARSPGRLALSADLVSDSLKTDFVLFYTGWDRNWEQAAYFDSFPYLSPELAAKLSQLPIKGVGIDGPSVDARDSRDFKAHLELLGNGKLILENLTGLSQLLNQSFTLFALPLKVKQSDGAPARVLALTKELL